MEIRKILEKKKLHIFDMDGTLVNLEELNRTSYSKTVKKYFNLNLTSAEYQKYFSGTKTALAFDSYLQNKNVEEYSVDELIKNFRSKKDYSLKNDFDQCVSLIPNSDEYLQHLKEDGKVIVLATSTIRSFTEIILGGLRIIDYFDYIITAEDVVNGKPDPEIYNLSVKKAGLSKEISVVYEDSKNGIMSAKSASFLCIGVHTQGFNDDAVKGADYIINDYSEILTKYIK